MTITNYTELQQAVSDWMARGDVSGNAADFISLAEARLNRELNPVETDVALVGVISSRTIDISSIAMVKPIALFIAETGGERPLLMRANGTFPYIDSEGKPSIWSIDGSTIAFDRPCDQAYSFRSRYQERFALSGSVTTNSLLTLHPDVYLAATLMWGGVFTQDGAYAAGFKTLLDEAIPSIRSNMAQGRRGLLMVDPGLVAANRSDRWYFDA
jgi:hypothetical protein